MKLKEKFESIHQRLQNDDQKDVIRKILLNLSSHEQTRESQSDLLNDTFNDQLSSISIPCVQADDVDTGNAFE